MQDRPLYSHIRSRLISMASWKTRVLMILSVSLWRQNSVLYSLDTEETQRKQHHREARYRCQFLAKASVPSSLEKKICWQRIMQQNYFVSVLWGEGPHTIKKSTNQSSMPLRKGKQSYFLNFYSLLPRSKHHTSPHQDAINILSWSLVQIDVLHY